VVAGGVESVETGGESVETGGELVASGSVLGSSASRHPEMSVSTAGHLTARYFTAGLSELRKSSNRQLQPLCISLGSPLHWSCDVTPPNRWPQAEVGSENWAGPFVPCSPAEQPLKIPKPPPGI